MGRTNPGPDYIRAEEWHVAHSGRRARWRRWTSVAVVVALLGVVAVWRIPSMVTAARIRGVLDSIDHANALSIGVSSYTEDGTQQPMAWGDWVSGAFERQSLGRANIERRGTEMFLSDEKGGGTIERFDMESLNGRAHFHRLLEEAARNGLHRVEPSGSSGGRAEYEVVRGAERLHFWFDEQKGRFFACVVSHLGVNGWRPVAEVAGEVGAAYTTVIDPVSVKRTREVDVPREVEARLPLARGGAIEIGPVHLSQSGAVFVVVRKTPAAVPPYLTDDNGMRYFRADIEFSWPELPAVEYMFVPMDPADTGTPRTIRLHFPARQLLGTDALPPHDVASFNHRFDKPNCVVVPSYRINSSAAGFKARFSQAITRAEHMRGVVRFLDAQVVDIVGGEAPSRADETPTAWTEDRRSAMAAYREALELIAISGWRQEVRSSIWYRLSDLENQFGDPVRAQKCLESAYHTLSVDISGPKADEIRRRYEATQGR